MDQLVIDISFAIMYPDLIDLIEILEKSGNEMAQAYAEELTNQKNKQIETEVSQ